MTLALIPIGDSPKARRFPAVNWLIILANFAVFIYMLTLSTDPLGNASQRRAEFDEKTAGACYGHAVTPTEIDRFFCDYSFQPKEFFDTVRDENPNPQPSRLAVLLSIVTSTFVHGGWVHILGNMLFLWVFGDNVEDRLGHFRYVLFYLVAGIVAALVQGFIDTESVVPTVGASGAVAGVLGAYLVLHPKAIVRVLIPFFPLIFIPLPVPAIVMIGLWFVQNLFAGLLSLGETSAGGGVAFFAHIGGFVFGMLVALLFFSRSRERPPPRWRT